MVKIAIYLGLILAVGLSVMSCGVKPTKVKLETGPLESVDINIPLPEKTSKTVDLNLEFISGKLKIAPGATGTLVSGTAASNADELIPTIDMGDGIFTMRQGDSEMGDFPIFQDEVFSFWDLQLANVPMNLNIQAGAYDGEIEMGGLSLKNISIFEGGSDLSGSFSSPNQVEMDLFTFSTGGSSMVWTGLANANFAQMDFNAGAGEYTLSFDGQLQRDANVSIESGAGTVCIIVPESVNAELVFDGGLTTINNDGWEQSGNLYKLSGSGPMINITVEMGLGTLDLKTK